MDMPNISSEFTFTIASPIIPIGIKVVSPKGVQQEAETNIAWGWDWAISAP